MVSSALAFTFTALWATSYAAINWGQIEPRDWQITVSSSRLLTVLAVDNIDNVYLANLSLE